jgi:hypothetical protein
MTSEQKVVATITTYPELQNISVIAFPTCTYRSTKDMSPSPRFHLYCSTGWHWNTALLTKNCNVRPFAFPESFKLPRKSKPSCFVTRPKLCPITVPDVNNSEHKPYFGSTDGRFAAVGGGPPMFTNTHRAPPPHPLWQTRVCVRAHN